MNNANSSSDRGSGAKLPETKPRSKRKVRTPGDNVKHVLDTGLPPGIEVEDAEDPGAHASGGPVENRS